MGKKKGKSTQKTSDKSWLTKEERMIGCGCPHQCLSGAALDEKNIPNGSVQLECSNKDCPGGGGWVHEECIVSLEDYLVSQMIKSKKGAARDWEPSLAHTNLWRVNRGYDLIFRLCVCPHPGCTGYRRRDPGQPPFGETQVKAKAKTKPSTERLKPNLGRKLTLAPPASTKCSTTAYKAPWKKPDEYDGDSDEDESETKYEGDDWKSSIKVDSNWDEEEESSMELMTEDEKERSKFLHSLANVVKKAGGRISEDNEQVHHLFSSAAPLVMMEMADDDGPAFWLLRHSRKLRVRMGEIIDVKLLNAPRQIQGIGFCHSVESPDTNGRRGVIFAQVFQQNILFDHATDFGSPSVWPQTNDIISFLAEEMEEQIGCKYRALTGSIILSGESAADDSSQLQTTQAPIKVFSNQRPTAQVSEGKRRFGVEPVEPLTKDLKSEWGSAARVTANHSNFPLSQIYNDSSTSKEAREENHSNRISKGRGKSARENGDSHSMISTQKSSRSLFVPLSDPVPKPSSSEFKPCFEASKYSLAHHFEDDFL